jgi:hypothetical protein
MTDLVVIVPSRGRPDAALELARVFGETCAADTKLLFAIDADDPRLNEYSPLIRNGFVDLAINASTTMVEALNRTAVAFANPGGEPAPFAIGFLGDDHRPRTQGWDRLYVEALRELGTGIVYGNDLLQGERIPTQVAMTSDIVRALGFMAPPTLTHLYVDNFWRDLGEAAGCLRYLPDVVVEHMHPVAGKADWDEGHVRVNQPSMYQRDAEAYGRYVTENFAADLAKVQALR